MYGVFQFYARNSLIQECKALHIKLFTKPLLRLHAIDFLIKKGKGASFILKTHESNKCSFHLMLSHAGIFVETEGRK